MIAFECSIRQLLLPAVVANFDVMSYVMVKSAVQDLLFPVRVTPVTEQRPAAAARPFTPSWGGAGGRAALLD